MSLVNINNNCLKYLKLCLGGVCAGEQNCSPLAFPEFLGISWVRNPENPFQWMNECTLIADKQIYLLLCVPSVQDFCCSSACCLMGQVKLSLSPWRSWDFNVISAARRFHHGTSEEKNTEFFSIFFHFLHQQFIKRSLWFLLSSKLKQWRTWISLNPARAFQVGIQEICWKREGAAWEDPAGIPGWSDRNVLAVHGTPPASSGDREFCWRSPVESSDPPFTALQTPWNDSSCWDLALVPAGILPQCHPCSVFCCLRLRICYGIHQSEELEILKWEFPSLGAWSMGSGFPPGNCPGGAQPWPEPCPKGLLWAWSLQHWDVRGEKLWKSHWGGFLRHRVRRSRSQQFHSQGADSQEFNSQELNSSSTGGVLAQQRKLQWLFQALKSLSLSLGKCFPCPVSSE